MKKLNIDYLNLYRGSAIGICSGIALHIPTLSEICEYGETRYYQMVTTLCSTGIDFCWQLDEMGIPFDEISDYQLFCQLLRKYYTADDSRILFGSRLDLSKMKICVDQKNNILLIQREEGNDDDIMIDEDTYFKIAGCLRAIHHLKRDDRVAGTNSCRRAFIEDAKMEYEARKLEPAKSTLLPMISTMVNSEGFKRNDKTVWDMNIFAFMDSVKRISKIKNADLLLRSGYSGFGVDLKKVRKEELNYMGELH